MEKTTIVDKKNTFRSHKVRITNASLLSDIVNKDILGVNSIHHQGIPAPSLKEAAIRKMD